MRHRWANQVTYNDYRATLPKTVHNWDEDTQIAFAAFAKTLLIGLNIITAIIQFIELRSMVKTIFGSWG